MDRPIKHHPASFRDPSGFVYYKEGIVYRFVSAGYKEQYDLFLSSGLKDELQKTESLLPFAEKEENHFNRRDWYRTLLPDQIPFLNYPWEWSFDQLKDAALIMLDICKRSLQKNMILKDATHLNIQFINGKPRLIDHLSFDLYTEGTPWIAYRQFCECFLNPLLLASYKNLELQQLFAAWPEGIPASVTANLLPLKCRFKPSLALHVYLMSRISGKTTVHKKQEQQISKKSLEHILDSLYSVIRSLTHKPVKQVWDNYYKETILSQEYLAEKKQAVEKLLQQISYETVLDLGANEGEFSLLCREHSFIVAVDSDSTCVNEFYKKIKAGNRKNILPLVANLTQPTPATGWMNKEQPAFLKRAKADLVLALALIHHICIGKNIPIEQLALLLSQIGQQLIIEFVPKYDPKVIEMLANRSDIFYDYNESTFEIEFEKYFTIVQKKQLEITGRILYQMYRK